MSHPFKKQGPTPSSLEPTPKIKIKFDGTEFAFDHDPRTMFDVIPLLYMCYNARKGDDAAKELLIQANIAITDCNDKSYWPIIKEEEEN